MNYLIAGRCLQTIKERLEVRIEGWGSCCTIELRLKTNDPRLYLFCRYSWAPITPEHQDVLIHPSKH